jgi:hypothetical protein
MSSTPQQPMELSIVDDIGGFVHDPAGYVRYAFPWGEDRLANYTGARTWQREILETIGAHLRNPATRHQPLQIAVASGHDIGKSALIAMILCWGLSTHEDTKVIVTAGTKAQLDTKTVPEVQKWFRLAINADWWDLYATSVRAKDPGMEGSWRADFIPWSVARADAFQGLHNLDKRILIVFDEASAIDDKIWERTEGVTLDENTEIIWIAFGNPTKNTGRFRDCFGKFKHRWITKQIDSSTVEGTNKLKIKAYEEDYGFDSDFYRVRVRGEFPRAGINQFIPSDDVARCRKFKAPDGWQEFPKILGVDVARYGDDQTVLMLRQGRKMTLLLKTRGLSTAQTTDRVVDFMERENIDMTVVDADGIGATVYDQLIARGYGKKTYQFHGGHPASKPTAYFNRRTEIWGLIRDALKAGVQIPDDPELEADLTGPEYGFSNQSQVQLEKKDDMKARGLSSPDMGDAAAMTYAIQLMAKPKPPKAYDFPSGNESWMA